MIICNSNNFVVTRAPKVAGLSLEMYMHKSGLVDAANDTYSIDGGLSTLEELEKYSQEHENLKFEKISPSFYAWEKKQGNVNATFSELVESYDISPSMPCIGSVRHPLHWAGAFNYYAVTNMKKQARKNAMSPNGLTSSDFWLEDLVLDPNKAWDILMVPSDHFFYVDDFSARQRMPQTDYYPDHAQLFNIENIHEHANAFITEKGGTTSDKITLRDSDTAEHIDYFLKTLSDDRKQKTLDIFEKDFLAWEKAYAVYN